MQPRLLSDLCLISIRNGLESGEINDLSTLVPSCCQKFFKLALMQGLVENPTFVSMFASVDFLNSLNGIMDFQHGCMDDSLFLNRVAQSLDSPVGQNTLGFTINELRLNLYSKSTARAAINLKSAIKVISKCKNVRSLHVHAVLKYDCVLPSCWSIDCSFLNRSSEIMPIMSIMENLEELSLTSNGIAYTLDDRPVIKFNHLKSLRFEGMEDDFGQRAWTQLMRMVQNSLIKLELRHMNENDVRDDEGYQGTVLPFPMPKLQSFHMASIPIPIGLNNLINCPDLNDVSLEMHWPIRPLDMTLLNRLTGNVTISIFILLCHQHSDRLYLDNPINFDLLNKPGFKTHLDIEISCGLSEGIANVLQQMMSCPNLIKLKFQCKFHGSVHHPDLYFSNPYRSMDVLETFFNDHQRASELRHISLRGPIHVPVLEAMLMNCSNMETLDIRHCYFLENHHLINLTSDYLQLSELSIIDCQQITEEGLIPLLMISGERLKKFAFTSGGNSENFSSCLPVPCTNYLWNTLANYCPDLESVAYFAGDEDAKKEFMNQAIFK